MAFDVFVASLGLASAFGIAGLGLLSILGGRSRPRGAFAFGLFCVVWGIQIALAHLANITSQESVYRTLMLLVLGCLIALPYFLVEFVAAWMAPSRLVRAWRSATIALALVNAAIFGLAPHLLFERIVAREGYFFPEWGPLHVLLVTLPFFLAFGLALVGLASARRASPTPRTSARLSVLLGGLGLYVGFAAGNNLVFYGRILFESGDVTSLLFTFVFACLAAFTVGVAIWLFREAATMPTAWERRTDRLVAFALLIPLGYGAIEAAYGPVRLETTGLWRLAGVAVLTYGIARWRMYDLPQRATRAAATATGATAAVATGAAAYGAGAFATNSTAVPVLAALVVLGASLLPAVNFARRLFGVQRAMPRRDLEEALYGQRIEAYRAALEASLARGTLDEDASFLAALRERFSISPDEDRVLTHLARSSVVVARSRHAWDAYERLRLLGEGGGGRTWLARDRARDRLVVLKEPLERWQQEPAAREAVLREARMAAKVRHPHVVAVEEVVEGKGSPVIVMEYLEGGSLADLLRARGTLNWPEAKSLMLDVLQGVEAIHAGGIVHRDLKPSNILLTAEGVAKVADFGIAVSPTTSGQRTMVMDPLASTVAGTKHYMAPEALGGSPPDKRADIYACAAIMHELLYGAPPGLRSPTVVRKDLPAAVPGILARALADKPEARTPTARALAEELAAVA